MEFQQFYLGCLAQGSYLVGDRATGLCAIVDPRRDVDVYLEAAAERGLAIAHVIETHLHADFVSGHVELARRTGAAIHIGHRAGAQFPHVPARDGDELQLGAVALRFLETPGHTPESLCVLVLEARGGAHREPVAVLTGDTLFVGDVGRPDLVSSQGLSARDMAGMLYDSLSARLLPLPDAVAVYPGHGAGSACGRNISPALSSTMGEQKALNWALQPMGREEFIERATSGLASAPGYFAHDAAQNRAGAAPLSELPAPAALAPAQVQAALAAGAIALDVREKEAYGAGHLPGALNIGLGGSFAPWAGALLPLSAPLVLVADDEAAVAAARMRLARVGLHEVAGFLAGGVAAWSAAGLPLVTLPQLPVEGLRALRASGAGPLVLDVRGPGEHAAGHVPGALNLPLPQLLQHLAELDPERPTAVVCQSAYRSSAACGLLERAGFRKLYNVAGGTQAWVAAGYEVGRPQGAGT